MIKDLSLQYSVAGNVQTYLIGQRTNNVKIFFNPVYTVPLPEQQPGRGEPSARRPHRGVVSRRREGEGRGLVSIPTQELL